MKKFAIVLAVMLGIFCLNGIAFSDTIVQNTVPKERTIFGEYEKALEHYNKGEFQKSIDILKDYIKQTPDPWGYWLMGYSLYKLQRFDEANQYFRNAFLVDPAFSPTPTLEKELKHPYGPARPEGYPEGVSPTAAPAPVPKLQQGLKVVTEPAPAEKPVAKPAPAAPTPVEPAPAPPAAEPVPAPPAQAPVPAPAAPIPPPAAVPPPVTQQAAQAPAQPEAPEVAPPPPPPAPKPSPQPAPKPAPQATKPAAKPFPVKPLPKDIIAFISAMIFTILIFFLIGSVVIGIFIFLLARKLGVRLPFLGFVPVIQFWTLSACAGMSTLMTILLFILLIVLTPLATAIIFLKVAEQLGKSKVLGLILGLLLPIIPLIWFAFAGGGGGRRAAGGLGGMPDLSGEPDIPDLDFDLEEEAPAPKAKPAAKAEEPSQYADDWELPDEE